MRTILSFISFLLFSQISAAQVEGMIKGTVIEESSQEPLPFCRVVATLDDKQFMTQTDFDGNYRLNGLPPGIYSVEIRFVGYDKGTIKDVKVNPDSITMLDHAMKSTAPCICICNFSYQMAEFSNPAVPK